MKIVQLHCVLRNNGRKKLGVVLKLIVFSSYVHIPLFLRILLYIFCVRKIKHMFLLI